MAIDARSLFTLIPALLLPALVGAAPPPFKEPDAALLLRFGKLPLERQAEVLATVQRGLAELKDPFLEAVRLLAWQERLSSEPRVEKFPKKSKSRTGKGDFAGAMPFPIRHEYVFGLGIIVPVGTLYAKKNPKAGKVDIAGLAARDMREELASFLRGFPPGLDRALAVLLRKMDRDPGADRFFAYLESWRNGEESFYQALDRTAGTPESVFFYDAMLEDFVRQFVPDKGSYTHLRRNLSAAHDALHRAFLAYRQYRGFREAVAFSLLLPPDVSLPPTLARYEQEYEAGNYNLRQQITMFLALKEQNPTLVATIINRSAEKMPQPLWSKKYDPFAAYSREFLARLNEMAGLGGSTSGLVEMQNDRRRRLAEKVAARAREILKEQGIE